MARVKYNVVTHGISGKIGDLLQFRQRNGKTIIAKIAAKTSRITPAQILIRQKFSMATSYAKAALKDPAVLEYYQERATAGITPYNLALKDYFTVPVISSIDTVFYTGDIGSRIIITATDDTKVTEVIVQLWDNSGNQLETGAAIKEGEQDLWIYTASRFNSVLSGTRIVVQAKDLPGNMAGMETVL